MKKVLSLLFLLFALNSVCVAEIMEDYRMYSSPASNCICLMNFHFTVGNYNPIFHECNRFLFLGQSMKPKTCQ
jgi:hypothetical protein